MMNIIITIVGLLLSLSGIYLAWHKKGYGIWATFAFGFILVLVGGPLSSRLGSLSVTGTGIEVDFSSTAISSAEAIALTQNVEAAFLSITPKPIDKSPEKQKLIGSASQSFQKDLTENIRSRGFTPIQPTGAELLPPGTVIRIEQGQPIVWASSSEAFPHMQSTVSSVGLPEIRIETSSKKKVIRVEFSCKKNSYVSEVSLYALSANVSPSIVDAIGKVKDLKIIQSILICEDFSLSSEISSEFDNDSDQIGYGESSKIILGVRFAELVDNKAEK